MYSGCNVKEGLAAERYMCEEPDLWLGWRSGGHETSGERIQSLVCAQWFLKNKNRTGQPLKQTHTITASKITGGLLRILQNLPLDGMSDPVRANKQKKRQINAKQTACTNSEGKEQTHPSHSSMETPN